MPQALVCLGEDADESLDRERLQYYWRWDALRQYSSMNLGTSFAAPSKDAGCRTWPRSPQSHWESQQQPPVLCLLWENGSGLAPHWGSGQSLQKLELECGPSGTPLSVPEGDGERWRGGRLDAMTVGGRPAQWKAICPSARTLWDFPAGGFSCPIK